MQRTQQFSNHKYIPILPEKTGILTEMGQKQYSVNLFNIYKNIIYR